MDLDWIYRQWIKDVHAEWEKATLREHPDAVTDKRGKLDVKTPTLST